MKRLSVAALLIVAAACSRNNNKPLPVATATVQRRDIVIDAQASGAVEPIAIVEVKSKASGVITRVPVETGTMVKPGDLLVQVDTRDVNNQLEQSKADLDAAQAKYDVSIAQKKRSDDMFAAKVITAQEHETASLDLRNANTALIRANAPGAYLRAHSPARHCGQRCRTAVPRNRRGAVGPDNDPAYAVHRSGPDQA